MCSVYDLVFALSTACILKLIFNSRRRRRSAALSSTNCVSIVDHNKQIVSRVTCLLIPKGISGDRELVGIICRIHV